MTTDDMVETLDRRNEAREEKGVGNVNEESVEAMNDAMSETINATTADGFEDGNDEKTNEATRF